MTVVNDAADARRTMETCKEVAMKVDRIYTRSVIGTSRHDSIADAAASMRRFHVGALLVLEAVEPKPQVVGIVTDRDLVLLALAEGVDCRALPVEKVMSPVVASVSEGADVLEALERMRAAGVRRLMVTGPRGDPAGILSIDDIVDGLAAELASAAALMKSEIRREAAATVRAPAGASA
ncbi:MAG TPA: CBS domain-containing protein [Usitatibacter sp.]|nr:CBS domain-containing protein [Usitatibacter sp.]